MKRCPFCAEEIQDAAIVCRFCGRDLPAPTPATESPAQTKSLGDVLGGPAPKPPDVATPWGKIVGVIIGIVLLALWAAMSNGTSAPPKPEHDPITAFVMCQDFVNKRLRAPASAKYPWFDESMATHLGNGKYRVRAYVDAQNGFGALIRTQFVCEIDHQGGDRWRLTSLNME